MEPLYFGEKSELFGIYHSAIPAEEKNCGIVMCYPFGQEYIRCHRAYLKLANELSDKGFHTLRFDYYGTGDSLGNSSETGMERCYNDAINAINELKEGCKLDKIIVLGVRLGGIIAIKLSRFIDGLILWSPVLDGKTYTNSIKKIHKDWFGGSFAKQKKQYGEFESMGFSFSKSLSEEINSIELNNLKIPENMPVLLIDESKNTQVQKFRRKYEQKGDLEFTESINKEFWMKQKSEAEKSMVPFQEINIISEWLNKNTIN